MNALFAALIYYIYYVTLAANHDVNYVTCHIDYVTSEDLTFLCVHLREKVRDSCCILIASVLFDKNNELKYKQIMLGRQASVCTGYHHLCVKSLPGSLQQAPEHCCLRCHP